MPLQPNDLLLIERGGTRYHMTADQLPAFGGQTGPATGLPDPALIDQDDAVFFYFGWSDTAAGGWLIQRQRRADGRTERAEAARFPTVSDLMTAWAERAILEYI